MQGDKQIASSTNLDSLIQDVLRKSRKPLSTYELAKKTGVSWSTANIHCFKLKTAGVVKNRVEQRLGSRMRVIWSM
jgi:ribosomal protein S25